MRARAEHGYEHTTNSVGVCVYGEHIFINLEQLSYIVAVHTSTQTLR